MKKITIFCLYLCYEEVEVSIINLANMLSDKYNVEVISFYNFNVNLRNKFNDNISITNLYNGDPNREKFNYAVSNFKILDIIKEGIKNYKISKLKKKLLKDEIEICNSDLIISSRIEITELISKYYKGNAKIVSLGHSYHNHSQEYITKLIENLKNIDYFMPFSKKITKFYKNKVGENSKVMYFPLCVNYIPEKETKKIEKNIVSIGRMCKKNAFDDLLDVFSMVHMEDDDCHLYLFGNGIERNNLEVKIKKLNLSGYVSILDYYNDEIIKEKLNDMSLYLTTSFDESLCHLILEVSAYGIPSIAFSNSKIISEIIRDDIDGYVIDNRNKKEMKEKILELMNNKKKLANFGHEARLKSEEYNYDITKEKWISIIDNILNK